MFWNTIAPDTPMGPGRFPVGEAVLVSMARNVFQSMVRPPPTWNALLRASSYRVQEAAGGEDAGIDGSFMRLS